MALIKMQLLLARNTVEILGLSWHRQGLAPPWTIRRSAGFGMSAAAAASPTLLRAVMSEAK